MRSLLLVLPVALLAGCTDTPEPAARPTPVASASAVAAQPCVSTPYRFDDPPDWTASAHPPTGLPWFESAESNLVGFVFGDPLHAPPTDTGPTNKILFVVREPRDGQPLRLRLTPGAGGAPVETSQPADSSPGLIYPSIVDVPRPGCWRVEASWAGHRATLALTYRPTVQSSSASS